MFNEESKYWYLRGHQIFSVLKKSQLQEICLISNFKKAKKGEIIYFSHDESNRVYFLKQGTIKIVTNDGDGNEIVKDVLLKGDLFGQFTLDDDQNDDYAVVASESVVCCSFKMEDFETLIQKNPDLGLKYTKWLGFRFKRLQNKYSNLMFKDVKTRLYIFLKEWIEREAVLDGEMIVLKNYLTHQDIASLICSTRQTVTQLFNEYRDKNIISYSRQEIRLNKNWELSAK